MVREESFCFAIVINFEIFALKCENFSPIQAYLCPPKTVNPKIYIKTTFMTFSIRALLQKMKSQLFCMDC